MVTQKQFMRRMLNGFLAVALVFTAFMGYFIPTEAAEEPAVMYEARTDMGDYWAAADGEAKAPAKQGYIFAGWYTSSDKEKYQALKEADINPDSIPTTNTYAKFVKDDILSVKTMVEGKIETESTNILQDGDTSDDYTDFRFLSAVDSTDYQEVGFEYSLGGKKTNTKAMTKVWSTLRTSPKGQGMITAHDIFGTDAGCFIALDVTDVYEVNFSKIIYVRPYWVTMDGTKVMGMAKNVRVEDKYTDYSYVSVPINILTDSKLPAEIAGGKLTFTYNKDDYRVVTNGSGQMMDTGRVLPELVCYVDEAEGKITIIANAVDVKNNLLADGLFANIRFQHKTEVSKGNLEDVNLQPQNSSGGMEFCNWAEADLTSKVYVQ